MGYLRFSKKEVRPSRTRVCKTEFRIRKAEEEKNKKKTYKDAHASTDVDGLSDYERRLTFSGFEGKRGVRS